MKRYFLIVLVLFLLGCEKPEPVDIVQPQREAMEKARGVERTLQQGADDTRRQIDEAER